MRIHRINPEPPLPVANVLWARVAFEDVDCANSTPVSATAPGPIEIELPSELSRASFRRRREWLAGRACGLDTLKRLGREGQLHCLKPRWPLGVAGSISHDQSGAMAVVSTQFSGLGVDCVRILDGSDARLLAPVVLAAGDEDVRPASMTYAGFLTVLFSAKEAAFKALTAREQVNTDMRSYAACELGPSELTLSGPVGRLKVRWRLHGDGVVALAMRHG